MELSPMTWASLSWFARSSLISIYKLTLYRIHPKNVRQSIISYDCQILNRSSQSFDTLYRQAIFLCAVNKRTEHEENCLSPPDSPLWIDLTTSWHVMICRHQMSPFFKNWRTCERFHSKNGPYGMIYPPKIIWRANIYQKCAILIFPSKMHKIDAIYPKKVFKYGKNQYCALLVYGLSKIF